uniref:hypothetical protein n=1 Tax=Mariniflexile sp. TaxID=1979402 RepID=UPI0040485907
QVNSFQPIQHLQNYSLMRISDFELKKIGIQKNRMAVLGMTEHAGATKQGQDFNMITTIGPLLVPGSEQETL